MEYDLLIRGGRVVDGSGFPSYLVNQVHPAQIISAILED